MTAKHLACECKHCEAMVSAEVIGSYQEYDTELNMPFQNSLLKCPKCSSPILVTQDIFCDHNDFALYGDTFRLYPEQEHNTSGH